MNIVIVLALSAICLVFLLVYFLKKQNSLRELIVNLESEIFFTKENLEQVKKSLEESLIKNDTLENETQRLLVELTASNTKNELEKKNIEEKLNMLKETKESMKFLFEGLSRQALDQNAKSFLDLAKQTFEATHVESKMDLNQRQKAIDDLVKPLKESLEKVDVKINEMERERQGAYIGLKETVNNLLVSQYKLQSETQNLVNALRAPNVRGRWGEIQLKRVVEMSGMVENCDFTQQVNTDTDEGRMRPDLIIHMPSKRKVIVDAKAPLQSYLEAIEMESLEDKRQKFKDHARLIRTHIQQLSSKKYWDQFEESPDFVVLFLPGEAFFSAALEQDPSLIEMGVEQRVILSTPTTLIALLRAIAYGWKQEEISKNAEKISLFGQELYDRIITMTDHFVDMKRGLEKSVESYNKAMSSLETRVLPSARKFHELGLKNSSEMPALDLISQIPKILTSPEFSK